METTDEKSIRDANSVRQTFFYALSQDLLSPVIKRLKGNKRVEQEPFVLLGKTSSKTLLKKKSGTRSGDEWMFSEDLLSTRFVTIASMIAGMNCRYESYQGMRSAFAGYRAALVSVLDNLADAKKPNDPPSCLLYTSDAADE